MMIVEIFWCIHALCYLFVHGASDVICKMTFAVYKPTPLFVV